MSNFTKTDLKLGMIVKTRNGNLYMVYGFDSKLILVNEKDYVILSDYRNNLLHYHEHSAFLDIMSIHKPQEISQFREARWGEAPIIWERKELPKLTEVEKVILENAMFNSERFGWISRDKNGIIHLYINRPEKNEAEDIWMSDVYISLNIYNHLFRFIKWDDSDPYSISDLLSAPEKEKEMRRSEEDEIPPEIASLI